MLIDSGICSSLSRPTIPEFVEQFPEEYDNALRRLRWGGDLVQSFLEGVANLRIDVEIEGKNCIFGVWLRLRPKALRNTNQNRFPVHVIKEKNETGDAYQKVMVVAQVGFEVVPQDTRRAGVWFSTHGRLTGTTSPPNGWLTGNRFVDTEVHRAHDFQQPRLDGLYPRYDGDIEILSGFAPEFVRCTTVEIGPDGIRVTFDPLSDHRLKLVDVVIGPFNHRR